MKIVILFLYFQMYVSLIYFRYFFERIDWKFVVRC